MKSLASQIRSISMIIAHMEIEADITSNIKNTWNAIKETDLRKKIEIFVQRAGDAIKRWMDSRMPGIGKAISVGTDGALILSPMGELLSKDRQIRVKL